MAPVEDQVSVGFWGAPTSTMDWCEGNYQVTPFIAEFWNTISNVVMIIPPLVGIYQAIRLNLEQRYVWLQFCFFLVGLGSWSFHMTLRYGMQIADELPMVFGSCYYIYTLFEVCRPPKSRIHLPLAVSLMSYSIIATVVYVIIKAPVLFHCIYGVTVVITMLKALYNIKTMTPCKQVSQLYYTSLLTYTFGFALWLIDNHLCYQVKFVRNSVPSVISPVTQLHAWWHALAGLATYQSIVFNCLSRQIFLGRKCKLYVPLGLFPYLVFHDKE